MERTPHRYKVGNEVSRGFNGDYYPCGVVTFIGKKYLKTSTGHRFYLSTYIDETLEDTPNGFDWIKREVEFFKEVQSPFVLCKGHIDERNPHF